MTDHEHLLARFPHLIVCHLRGHRPDWLHAAVPNPHARESKVWGCSRCGRALHSEDYPATKDAWEST